MKRTGIERAALYPDHVHLDLRVALPAQAATPACNPGVPVRVSLGAIRVPAQGPVGRWARRTA